MKKLIKKYFKSKSIRILCWIILLFFTIDCLGIVFSSIDAVFLKKYSNYEIAYPFSSILELFGLTWHEEAGDSYNDIFGAMILYLFCAYIVLPLLINGLVFSKIKAFIETDKISNIFIFFIGLFYSYSLIVIILTRADFTWLGHLIKRSNFNFNLMMISVLLSSIITFAIIFFIRKKDGIWCCCI